jgi:hypothetical protein
VDIDVSACGVLADIADVNDVAALVVVLSAIVDGFGVCGNAGGVFATVAVVEDANELEDTAEHVRGSHAQMSLVGFVEQSC